MSVYRAQLAAAVQAITIRLPARFTWLGAPAHVLTPALRRDLGPVAVRAILRDALRAQLYQDFYGPGAPQPAARTPPGFSAGGDPAFVARLAAANTGSGPWEPGWLIRAAPAGRVLATRDGLTLEVEPAGCRPAPTPGAGWAIRLPRDRPGASPGFYLVLGDTPFAPGAGALLRLYWHVSAAGAARLLATVTARLNAAGLAFQLKVVNHPARYARADAAVLYLAAADYAAACPLLQGIYEVLGATLRPEVPALTRSLAPGLGLAEDPGGGGSFGLHRCDLIAEGLVRAAEAGATALAPRLAAVAAVFVAAGLDPDRPYLGPRGQDVYAFDLPPARPPATPRLPVAGTAADPAACLEVALGIGQRLADTAIWDGQACNWVGPVPAGGDGRAVYRALGPDLYAGTAGIALFLAELAAVTGAASLRGTALGAIRQALSHAAAIPPGACLGLYTGRTGVALAAVRVARRLAADEPAAQARGLLAGLADLPDPHEHDLLAGAAGAVLGLLALGPALGERAATRAQAARLGDRLLAAATPAPGGALCWPSRTNRPARPLTGLSHGVAGIGIALLALHEATGEAAYRQAGEAAFAYERYWFDAAAGNWPDFRWVRGSRDRRAPGAAFWCHGAPGIVLSRLQAATLCGDSACAAEVAAGLATTRAALAAGLRTPDADFALCHGLAGLAEVVRAAPPRAASPGDAALVAALAHHGADTYATPGRPWPGGLAGSAPPGLLLGLAGIGLFYLRLHTPAIPSILWPAPAL